MNTKILFNKKIKVGYDEDSPIYLNCEIKDIDLSNEKIFNAEGGIISVGNVKKTTTHKKVSKYKTLSITGSSKYMGGQIYDSLNLNTPDLKRIVEIWKEWHLNDLSPNCHHQKSFNCNTNDFDKLAEEQTKKCPYHYAYGSSWLIKILPDTIIDEIMCLFTNFKKVEK